MKTRKILALVLAFAMVMAVASVSAETVAELPRNETLYFAGLQWGAIASWNPIGANQNNALACTANAGGSRTLMFESLYMYNLLDGSLTPLLADGDYVWNDDLTAMTVKIKPAAKWSDGTPVTADDVAYTWDVSKRIMNGTGAGYKDYVDTIEVVDEKTLIIHCVLNAEGQPANPLQVLNFLSGVFVAQKAWIQTVEARCNNDATAILADPADDVVWSGPYTKYFENEQKVVLIRDDNYWGQDASMWGKLPVPKYIGHAMYADNAAGVVAFKANEIDVCQQFISNVQDLWLKDNLPISTYLEDAPYGICVTMPTAFYNMEKPVLAENPALRKAIAMAVDYDSIIENAMTNQSPSFADVPRSLMNPTAGEQAMFDHDAVKDLQWAGKDYDGAKALLDEAGLVDTDGDGWREWNGEKISLNSCCPNGWSDWQAAMEIVAAAGKEIGIEITTLFPEWSTYQTVFTAASQTEYDIFMYSPDGANPCTPWARARQFFASEFIGLSNNWSGNWGHYKNERADEILKLIPLKTDAEELKALYTELTQIYLTEVPSFSLMYRPGTFHSVNETYWTNYPEADDGRNIPPMLCIDGYSIAGLYDLKPVE